MATLAKFQVKVQRWPGGPIACVTRAEDEEAAVARALRAYPGSAFVDLRVLAAAQPETPPWRCAECGAERPMDAKNVRRSYCSRQCANRAIAPLRQPPQPAPVRLRQYDLAKRDTVQAMRRSGFDVAEIAKALRMTERKAAALIEFSG